MSRVGKPSANRCCCCSSQGASAPQWHLHALQGLTRFDRGVRGGSSWGSICTRLSTWRGARCQPVHQLGCACVLELVRSTATRSKARCLRHRNSRICFATRGVSRRGRFCNRWGEPGNTHLVRPLGKGDGVTSQCRFGANWSREHVRAISVTSVRPTWQVEVTADNQPFG